ncbi:MAG TPA: hypothetical protein VE953_25505 [Terriglobales bacterium]|nr:hypothetical protein [Terriglobales bacterium]
MFFPSETAYEEIRRRQRELHEQAARAQLLARARREAILANPSRRSGRSWLARRFRTNLARP